MEAINPVRVQIFWDSEIARDAYSPYFTGTIRKSRTLPTNRIISHAKLVKLFLKYQDMDLNLWNVRMTMRVPSYYEVHLCRENGSRTNTYMPEIYWRQTYRKTYQANFHPVLSENFWRDVPFNLTFYPPNMKKERGRKQGKRFQGEMDYRNPDSPPRCGTRT
ncbi:hypothetical protein M9H77_25583 [Catharanthus roseus]|uniref:Uncharacterized protein n=1 Tax=Catharanthus roseus TaxID=4058 RepID=A0ACC0A8S4_CATRO|nr:hypothetical protein M9H77_25583 [Catharanthus roseus]